MVQMYHLKTSPVPGTHLAAKFSNCTTNFNLSFPHEALSFLHIVSVLDVISLLPPDVRFSEVV